MSRLVSDRFHETHRIGRMELKPTDLILKEAHRSRVYPRSAHQVRKSAYSRLAVCRLEGWPLARSRLWPSFETRARARSSGRGLRDEIDMIRTWETLH